MKHCCEDKCGDLSLLRVKQSRALKAVFVLNLIMFFVEFTGGWKAGSTALLGDSLDMLGDAFVYGFSLYVLHKSEVLRIRAAQLKGAIMLLFGLSVLAQATYKIIYGGIPESSTMGIIGSLALGVNLICLWILYAHKEDDINMRSTWICSRNDIIANTSTLGAAFLVGKLNSNIPDIVVGLAIAGLFLSSAFTVFKESRTQMRLQS